MTRIHRCDDPGQPYLDLDPDADDGLVQLEVPAVRRRITVGPVRGP